jgi:hypothetical protein
VIQRMLERDKWRRSALQQYISNRRYVADNKGSTSTPRWRSGEYVYPGKKNSKRFPRVGPITSAAGHQ